MPYYVRAFCTSESVPPAAEVIEELRSNGILVYAEAEDTFVLSTPHWTEFELHYKEGKEPIVVDCARNTGPESIAADEVAIFIEEVGCTEDCPMKDVILRHLRATRFVIACQLIMDIDDDGYEANGEFLSEFVRRCGGLIQADGEGFWDGDEIVLPMR
jgi:hypothetical protein